MIDDFYQKHRDSRSFQHLLVLCEASHKLFHIYKDMGHRRVLLADEVGIVRRTASSSATH